MQSHDVLNALTISLDGDLVSFARSTRSMKEQGFAPVVEQTWLGGALIGWSHAPQRASIVSTLKTSDGFACWVGPIWYQGRFGRKAVADIFASIGGGAWLDEAELRGSFVLFLQKGADAWLINDAPGYARIYATSDGKFFSTSWLAARAYVDSNELDEFAAIEYVLLGAVHSNLTLSPKISKLPLGCGFDLRAGRIWKRFPNGIASGGTSFATFDGAVESLRAHLGIVFDEICGAFRDNGVAALSGGFDSRLILAGLLASGMRPRLFVYGNDASSDVAVAQAIAASERLDLTVIDKDLRNAARPAPDLDCLVENALFFDGFPNDGILDAGADRETRLAQSAGGAIALNGGGGEIFRNFFHLPDRRFHAIDVVRSFYRGFDETAFRRKSTLRQFETNLATAIMQTLDSGGTPLARKSTCFCPHRMLSRQEIELAYPLFRCHHWMSANNSVALRSGYFATPLVDLHLLRDTCGLPIQWKNAGRLESRLIASLNSRIARYPSAYGFAFTDGPHLRARVAERLTLARPIAMRPMIGKVKRALLEMHVPPALVAQWKARLKGEWRIDSMLNVARLTDEHAFSRALAVEVAARGLIP